MSYKWVIVLAGLFSAITRPAYAATVAELIEQGDRIYQSEDQYPDALQQALALYKQAADLEPKNALPHIRLARVYLALGDNTEDNARSWYEKGDQEADLALSLQEASADAHFYLAANRGNTVNLLPFWKVSPGIVAELEKHLLRALELDPKHARSLHMMGMVLNQTPGPLRLLLVGKKDQVESYLTRSAEADQNFAEVRYDLMQFYQDIGRPEQARTVAQAILSMAAPTPRREWNDKYRPAAEALLKGQRAQ